MKVLMLILIRTAGRIWCRFHGVCLGRSVLIHGFPRLVCKPGGKILMEDGCTINAALWSNAHNDGRRTVLFAGPGAELRMGKNSGLSSSRVVSYQSIRIGADSLIGAGCLICDSDMHEVPLGSGKPVASEPISIGERVFIGAGSTILKGVTIGDGAVIGAGSVVTSDIPAGMLAAGNPARVIRKI